MILQIDLVSLLVVQVYIELYLEIYKLLVSYLFFNFYKGTQDEMCLAFFMVYPKPELKACLTWHEGEELNDWFEVAMKKGYSTEEYIWEAKDDDDLKQCGDLWYDEYWTNDNYLPRNRMID